MPCMWPASELFKFPARTGKQIYTGYNKGMAEHDEQITNDAKFIKRHWKDINFIGAMTALSSIFIPISVPKVEKRSVMLRFYFLKMAQVCAFETSPVINSCLAEFCLCNILQKQRTEEVHYSLFFLDYQGVWRQDCAIPCRNPGRCEECLQLDARHWQKCSI